MPSKIVTFRGKKLHAFQRHQMNQMLIDNNNISVLREQKTLPVIFGRPNLNPFGN